MSGSVNQIKNISFAVLGAIMQAHGTGFYGNAPFPFNFHVVQNLVFHIPFCHGVGLLQNAVCQGGFAMVNVCDNAKVTDVIHHRFVSSSLFQRMHTVIIPEMPHIVKKYLPGKALPPEPYDSRRIAFSIQCCCTPRICT